MPKKFVLIFDDVMIKQLKKAGKNVEVRQALSRMFDKLELLGPAAGELADSQLRLYEMKQKRPPIRLYFRHVKEELHVFEYEMKRSQKQQQKTIDKLRDKARSRDRRE